MNLGNIYLSIVISLLTVSILVLFAITKYKAYRAKTNTVNFIQEQERVKITDVLDKYSITLDEYLRFIHYSHQQGNNDLPISSKGYESFMQQGRDLVKVEKFKVADVEH